MRRIKLNDEELELQLEADRKLENRLSNIERHIKAIYDRLDYLENVLRTIRR